MVSTVFAPPGPAAGSARQVSNPNTGNSYAFNGQGAAVVADADTPWFLTQGYTTTPAAGSGAVVYAPFMPDQGMSRVIAHPISGNSYVFNSAGAAVVSTADLPWFLSQGYVQLPSGTVMQEPLQPSQASPGVIVNPNTGNTYVVNGRGFIVAQAADVSWFQALGFAPVTGGAPALTRFGVVAPATASTGTPINFTVTALDQFGATFPGYAGTVHFTSTDGAAVLPANSTLTAGTGTFSATLNTVGSQTIAATDTVATSVTGTSGAIAVAVPAFPPQLDATQPVLAADFAGQKYWFGATVADFPTWLTAIGGSLARSSVATYLSNGTVLTAAANAPRFPSDLAGNPQGLRLTGAGTNIIIHSGFDSGWTQQNGTLTLAAGADPSGGAAAALSVPNATGTLGHGFFMNTTFTANTYTVSIFAKNAGYNFLALNPKNDSINYAMFDLTTGAATIAGTATAAGGIPLANGWMLCWVTLPMIAGAASTMFLPFPTSAFSPYAGDGTSGILAWGAQATQSTILQDYVPTTTVSVTQAADDLHGTIAWYNAATETLFADAVVDNPGTGAPAMFGIWDQGVSQNFIDVRAASTGFAGFVMSGNAAQYSPSATAYVSGVRSKGAIAAAAANFAYCKDGQVVNLGATGVMPIATGMNRFALGTNQAGVFVYGNLRQVVYWGIRGSNAGIQGLTT